MAKIVFFYSNHGESGANTSKMLLKKASSCDGSTVVEPQASCSASL